MKNAIVFAAVAALLAVVAYAGMGDVLTSWPAPKTYNVINGIAFEGEYIWLKHWRCEGGAVYKCTKSGSVVKEIGFPFHAYDTSYGLAFDGTYLWTIYHQRVGLDKCDHYVQYTTNGSVASVFWTHKYPLYYPSVAISWDGQYLWTDERRSGQSKPDAAKYTTAGSLLGTFAMAKYIATGSGYYNNQMWYGGPQPWDTIYGGFIGGAVVGSFPAPGGSCYAVGFDGEYLWTADRNTPQYIYKVDIDVVDVAPASVGRVKALYR